MKLLSLAPLALLLATGSPAHGQSQDLASKLVNNPAASKSWGPGVSARRDKAVQGGVAYRVTTTGSEATYGDVGIYSTVDKPVKSGDRLILGFWARLEKGPDGAQTATLPLNAIQEAAPSNEAIIRGSVDITPSWQFFQISGAARKDYPAGGLNAALQLAAAKQIVDVGPIYVFNMGQ